MSARDLRTRPRRGTRPGPRTKAVRSPRPPEPIDWGNIAAGVSAFLLCLLFALDDMGWLP